MRCKRRGRRHEVKRCLLIVMLIFVAFGFQSAATVDAGEIAGTAGRCWPDKDPANSPLKDWGYNGGLGFDNVYRSVGLDFGKEKQFRRVELIANIRTPATTYVDAGNVSMWVSNDNVTYTKVAVDYSEPTVMKIVLTGFSVKARYVKINCDHDTPYAFGNSAFQGMIKAYQESAAPATSAEKNDLEKKKEPEIVVGTGFTYGDGRYHLFYDVPGGGRYRVAYAYSEDGLHWIKPDLGLVKHKGSRKNNLLDLPRGPKGSWNDDCMCSCGALYQPDKWRMWVAGYHKDANGALHAQMTLAVSPDPINWKLVGNQPVIPNGPTGSFDWGFTRVPCVIKDGDIFRMYYLAGDGHNGWFAGYAESPDGEHWTKPNLGLFEYSGSKDNNLVLVGESARGENRVAHPWVFKDGDIYRMYYSVSVSGGTYSIGTATSKDGIRWVKNKQVVVLPRGPKGSFDYWYAAIPKVVHDADGYKMWYTGYNGGPTHVKAPRSYALGYATSSDGIHWKKYEGNPVFGGIPK